MVLIFYPFGKGDLENGQCGPRGPLRAGTPGSGMEQAPVSAG